MNPQNIAPLIHPLADAPGVHGVAVFDRTTCFHENLPQAFSRTILGQTQKLFDAHREDTNAGGNGNGVNGGSAPGGRTPRPVFVDQGTAQFLVAHFGSFAIAAVVGERADRSRVTDMAMQVGGALLENEPAPETLPETQLDEQPETLARMEPLSKAAVEEPRKVARLQVVRWADVKPVLVDALSQVIAQPLAQGVVDREMRFENIQPNQMTHPVAVRTFCDRLLTQVPMKSRHDSIRAEINRRLNHL